jgi:hypothetical protein
VLGLCDEYRETALGKLIDPVTGQTRHSDDVRPLQRQKAQVQTDYNCRVSGPEDSVMSHQDAAFAKHHNLLRPAHFRAITAPGCLAKNQNYYRCGQTAYETDYKTGCAKQPPECRGLSAEEYLK